MKTDIYYNPQIHLKTKNMIILKQAGKVFDNDI